MSDSRTIAEIMIGLPVIGAFVSVITQQRRSLVQANETIETERKSCGERITRIEERLDEERDDCDRRHRALASDFDELRALVRRYTPRDFPAVKEPGK